MRYATAADIVEYVRDFYAELGYGPTRQDIGEMLERTDTRNLPGVRRALAEGYIRYDEEGRLVPQEPDA